jgi:hypothetical protein
MQKFRCTYASKGNKRNRSFRLQNGDFQDMTICAFVPGSSFIYVPPIETKIIPLPPPQILLDTTSSDKSPYDAIFVKRCFEQGMFFTHAKDEKWKHVGFFIKSYFGDNEQAYELFDQFSKLCPDQYNAHENREKWDGFSVDGSKYESFGIFVNWAKLDNPKVYKQINDEIKALKRSDKSQIKNDKETALNEARENCDAVFAKLSLQFEETHTKIINESVFVKQLNDKVIIMSKKELMTSYEHIQCGVNANNTPVSFIQKWTTCNDKINQKDSMQIYPDASKCPKKVFNLWRPFAMELLTNPYVSNAGGLKKMLKHIEILCNNEKPVYNYFIGWIAMMIQKQTTLITLISKEGAGKGTLMQLKFWRQKPRPVMCGVNSTELWQMRFW